MYEFDLQTERCLECDGHWAHTTDCSMYTAPTLLTVEERVALRSMISAWN